MVPKIVCRQTATITSNRIICSIYTSKRAHFLESLWKAGMSTLVRPSVCLSSGLDFLFSISSNNMWRERVWAELKMVYLLISISVRIQNLEGRFVYLKRGSLSDLSERSRHERQAVRAICLLATLVESRCSALWLIYFQYTPISFLQPS
jgi:hypothetical protein